MTIFLLLRLRTRWLLPSSSAREAFCSLSFLLGLSTICRVACACFSPSFFTHRLFPGAYLLSGIIFSAAMPGYINSMLRRLGVIQAPIQFFQNPAYMFPVLIVIILWMSLGTSFLVFIAGFQGVDKQYYEAAAIDGITNRWQELWFVTLPLMKPQLLLSAVLSITGSFGVGGCYYRSLRISQHQLFRPHHYEPSGGLRHYTVRDGYACTIATLLFFMMIFCNMAVRRLLKGVGT